MRCYADTSALLPHAGGHLPRERNAAERELDGERLLVHGLEETGSENSVDLDRGSNHRVGQGSASSLGSSVSCLLASSASWRFTLSCRRERARVALQTMQNGICTPWGFAAVANRLGNGVYRSQPDRRWCS